MCFLGFEFENYELTLHAKTNDFGAQNRPKAQPGAKV